MKSLPLGGGKIALCNANSTYTKEIGLGFYASQGNHVDWVTIIP
jgi:hypothetical protein